MRKEGAKVSGRVYEFYRRMEAISIFKDKEGRVLIVEIYAKTNVRH